MEERQKLFEIEKEKELYESKVDFFTEIAHEVRTPLTLISSSVNFRTSSLLFKLKVTSKRATIPFRSAVMSTLSNFMESLLAPIFWKSRSCPVSSNSRFVFCTITLIYFFFK